MFRIAFTGHRRIKPEDEDVILRNLRAIHSMASRTPIHFHTGGAAGFDSVVFKELGPSPYAVNTLHIPYSYQWKALQEYLGYSEAYILDYMAALCQLCGPYDTYKPGLYQTRNEHMVDSADLVICYYNGATGGTHNAIEYAKQTGVPVVDIRNFIVR